MLLIIRYIVQWDPKVEDNIYVNDKNTVNNQTVSGKYLVASYLKKKTIIFKDISNQYIILVFGISISINNVL